jgi:hypothetical protein
MAMPGSSLRVRTKLFAALVMMFALSLAQARDVAGVSFPETLSVERTPLVLNGAGIRKKFFFDIYAGALYLPKKTNDADEALREPGPKRIVLHFLFGHVSKGQMADAWREGFTENLDAADSATLRPRIDAFTALFGDMKKGDIVTFDLLPKTGAHVQVNGEQRGVVPGDDFNAALLKIWLGPHPPTDALKAAMLGTS